MRASKKSLINSNRSRPRAFQRAIDEQCTLPISPPNGGTKRDFAVFFSKSEGRWKNVWYKVFCIKTCSGKVGATSFLYLTVHRWFAGDVPIYQKIALKVTHPFRKRWFRQNSLNSAAAMRANEKRWIIAYRKSTMRFPSNHRWTPCATLSGSKWEFLHLALPFISSLQVIVDILNMVCGLNIASPGVPAYRWQTVPEMGVAT